MSQHDRNADSRSLDYAGRFGRDTFSYDMATGLLYRQPSDGSPEQVYEPHGEWRGRCYACDRTVPLLTNESEGYAGFWGCDCGTHGHDEVFKCSVCGERWGESAAGESDSRLCGYCDGTFLWEPCPACGNPQGGELKHEAGDRYKCTECGAAFDADEDGNPVAAGEPS